MRPKDETREEIDAALKEIKEGKYVTHGALKKEMGFCGVLKSSGRGRRKRTEETGPGGRKRRFLRKLAS